MRDRHPCRAPAFPEVRFPALLLFPLLVLCLLGPAAAAEPDRPAAAVSGEDDAALPPRLGRVIFAKNTQAPNHIYIIGQNHRSPLSGANGDQTIQAQMEIYRIGEWLIRQQRVSLLLPEGFFGGIGEAADASRTDRVGASGEPPLSGPLDEESLRERLADTGAFVNAATLLNARYAVPFGQVEDEELFRAVASSFRQLIGQEGKGDPELRQRLSCFQERRTAVMLQNIPVVVERELRGGDLQGRKAIFIIGMAHIAEIIRFLEQEIIELTPAPEDSVQPAPCALALLEQGYGATVILPRTLAEDERAVRLTGLLGRVPQ